MDMLRMSGVSLIGCQMRRRLFPLACAAPIIFLGASNAFAKTAMAIVVVCAVLAHQI
jgi:hypothetical protein